jgi:hypothetical protein
MTWWLHSAAYPEIIEPRMSASAPQAWMRYSIRLAGRNWLRSYRALGKGGRFIGYGVSAAIEGGRRNVVLVTANFTWLGLVGLVPRKSAHWYNITTEEKKHPEWSDRAFFL